MRLTLRQLQIFRAIGLHGGTSAAALRLPLSQSATSAALGELELVLGGALFDRVGKRLLLNERGRALLPQALNLLDAAARLENDFVAGAQGGPAQVHLYASTTIGNYLLPPLLARHLAVHPNIRVEIAIGNTEAVVAAIEEFRTDLGFIEGPCHSRDVIVTPWLEDELVLVAAPTHSLATATRPLAAARLLDAIWLLREPGSGTRAAVDQALAPHLPQLPESMTLGSSEAIKQALAAGLGVSCLSWWAVRDLVESGRLAVLRTRLPRLTRRLSVIRHRSKLMSPALTDLIQTTGGIVVPAGPARRPTTPSRRRKSY